MQPEFHFSKNTPAGGSLTQPLAQRVAVLNQQAQGRDALDTLRLTLGTPETGRTVLVSSFGADSAVLLHMVAQIDKGTPVLFLDTLMLFPETIQYQADLTVALGLWNVRILRPDEHALTARDPDGALHKSDTDACCALRKTAPLNAALEGFDSWITGRKRHQAGTRAALDLFEADAGRIKINPLAHWTPLDVRNYLERHALPLHPLVKQGYPSIGCAPCTSPVAAGEDPRAGRWRGQAKTECGIHFAHGKLQREGKAA